MTLKLEEANLINLLRIKHRYGEIIIQMHEGIPQRIKKVETFDELHGDLQKTNPSVNWETVKNLNKETLKDIYGR